MMKLIKESTAICLGSANGVDLKKTLMGGQCFRFSEEGGAFCGVAMGRAVRIYTKGEELFLEGDSGEDALARWRSYLDLDTDYEAIRSELLAIEPRLSSAAERCGSVRILRQETWEALCCFVVSQNNNISRIRGIVERLCKLCAEPAEGGGYAFPKAEKVAELSVEQLREIGCGYRAEYIIAVARAVSSGEFDIEQLRGIPVDEARKQLVSLHGVGPKVADCVLLFGLHRLDCFPVDVWIKRALEGEFKNTALQHSPYAGVAQQYIFEYIREKTEN